MYGGHCIIKYRNVVQYNITNSTQIMKNKVYINVFKCF